MFTKNESRARAKNEQAELITFEFSESKFPVRNLLIDGEPWFVAMDVCEILGHTNHRVAVQPLDDDEKGVRKVYPLSGRGGAQKTTIINESGLYALILRSNKPAARTFRKWVTSEVLPSLRKRGYYSTQRPYAGDFIDARDMPYEERPVNGYNVRCIAINGDVWVSINDTNKALRSSTESSQTAKKLNAKQTLAIKIWLYGNTHPAWFTNELGLKLMLSGSRKLRDANQLTLPL